MLVDLSTSVTSFLGIFSLYDPLIAEFVVALLETLIMVGGSTLCALLVGFFLAVVLVITGSGGLAPQRSVYVVLDFLVNMLRSFPFLILLIVLIPLTRLLMGVSIGCMAAIVPLTIGAAPLVARLMEASLLKVDKGVIEAARSFGANNRQIMFSVMVREALPWLVLDTAVIAITLLGYSAMAGAVGAGGLGDLAIKYGYHRFQGEIMAYAVIILLVLVLLIQSSLSLLYRRLR